MNTKTRAAAYGVAALLTAGIAIFSGIGFGVLGPSVALNPTSPASVSILLTDPPTVPQGVTAVYLTYSSVSLHVSGLGDSGWVTVPGQGTIETTSLVNLSETISTGSVPSGRYNLLVFEISSAEVQYEGKNYSATVNNGRLIIPIVGGLNVDSSSPAAALVDVQPTVINLGTVANPQFLLTAGANALQLPHGEVADSVAHLGYKLSLSGRGWYHAFAVNHSGNLSISSLTLTSNSFSFSVSNPGADPTIIRLVVLAPITNGVGPSSTLASFSSSIVFAVQPDGSLVLLRAGSDSGDDQGEFRDALSSGGYVLSGGSSLNFNYPGTIRTLVQGGGIHSGTQYYVMVLGSHALSFGTVTSA